MTLNEQDILLLSAYIDGELTEDERVTLEARLQSEADLQAELDALQQTVTLIRAMPTLRAPRDYTLDPAQFGARPGNVLPFRALTYAAAAVIVAVFGLALFLTMGSSQDEAPLVMQDAAEEVEGPLNEQQTNVAQAQPQPTQEMAFSAPTQTPLPTSTPLPTPAGQAGAVAEEPQSPPEPQQEEAQNGQQAESEVAQGNVPAPSEDDGAASDVGQMIAETPLGTDDNDLYVFSTERADATLDEFFRDGDDVPEEEPNTTAEEGLAAPGDGIAPAPPSGALDQAAPALPEVSAANEVGREQRLASVLSNLLIRLQEVFAAVIDALR